MKKLIVQFIGFSFCIFLIACSQPKQGRITIQGKALGTFYTIHVYHSDTSETFRQSLQQGIDSVLAEFNQIASIYDYNSQISQINRNEDVEVDDLFIDVFQRSKELNELSQGAFDITVGPLVNAWGFGFTDSMHISNELIDSLLQLTGMKKVKVEGKKVIKEEPGILLDMNGIAKGYAVDIVSAHIESQGIHSYIVEIGGEVRTGNVKPNGDQWIIAIEKPAEEALSPQEEEQRIGLNNCAVATSGTYRRYYERSGERYSHTIDPFTGYPVNHSMLSATIIASDCMTADALATACMVLGIEKAMKLCESTDGVEGYFIIGNKDGSWTIRYTKGFEKYFLE
jgi:FAD:protein FMN transferase